MDITNITLWTVSLTLAVIGITFGIVASINSRKASKAVKDLIATSFLVEETQKIFFDGLKSSINEGRKVLRALKHSDLTYYDYSIAASSTRFHPIAPRSEKHLMETEFNELTKAYQLEKEHLDKEFNTIIGDYALLKSEKAIPKTTKAKLVNYHSRLVESATALVKRFTDVTHTVSIKLSK